MKTRSTVEGAPGCLEDIFFDFLDETFELTSHPSEDRTACAETSKSTDQTLVDVHPHPTAAPQQYLFQGAKSEVPARKESHDTERKKNNRMHQRNYQQRRKAEWNRLQAEVADLRQANMRLQSALQQSSGRQVMLSDRAALTPLPTSISHLPWKAPRVLDRHVLKRLMPAWHSGGISSCTVTAEQAADMHQVASLSSQQTIIMWQGYIVEMSACLRSTGPELDQSARRHITSLMDEYCCTYQIETQCNLRGHKSTIKSSDQIAPDFSLELAHVMQFTQTQKDALFRLRRNYLTQLSVIGRQRRQLLQQMQSLPVGLEAAQPDLPESFCSADDITQQLQRLLNKEETAYLQYFKTIGHEISTPWQAAVGAVHTPLPYSPDLVAMVNALALDAGQPPAHSFHAADDVQEVLDWQHTRIMDGTDTGASLSTEASATASACTKLEAKALHVLASLDTEDLTPHSIFRPAATAEPLTG